MTWRQSLTDRLWRFGAYVLTSITVLKANVRGFGRGGTAERRPVASRAWRYAVYMLGSMAVLMGCYWLFLLSAPRGWGGRSTLQILLFATLLLIIPACVSLLFGFRAILAAQEGRAGRALVSVLIAISAVPLAWLLTLVAHSRRMLPF